MAKRKIPNVNTQEVERILEIYIDAAQKIGHIEKPIAWALYQVWKWADKNEGVNNDG